MRGPELAANDHFTVYRKILFFPVAPRLLAPIDRKNNPAFQVSTRCIGEFYETERVSGKAAAEDLALNLRTAFVPARWSGRITLDGRHAIDIVKPPGTRRAL
jgi:hypothetical protein